MNQELSTLMVMPVEQRAELAVIQSGGKSLSGMHEYLGKFKNLIYLEPDNEEVAQLFLKASNEIGGVIKDHREKGKLARDDMNKTAKAIIAVENAVAEPAEEVKEFFYSGYKAWKKDDDERKAAKKEAKAREIKRIADIGLAIADITALPGTLLNESASAMASAYENLNSRDLEAEGTYGEFVEKAKEEKAKALEALKTAIDRASAQEEQARQFAEMKRQQEEAQAAIKAQQEEIARQQAELQRQQQEAAQAKLEAERAELAAKRQQHEEAERKIKEEQDRLAREAKERADAEAKAQADKEEAERQAALSPDKDKLMKFSDDLREFAVQNRPSFTSDAAEELFCVAIVGRINSLAAQIKERAGQL